MVPQCDIWQKKSKSAPMLREERALWCNNSCTTLSTTTLTCDIENTALDAFASASSTTGSMKLCQVNFFSSMRDNVKHQQIIANQWMPSNQTRDVLKCPDTCFLTSGAVLMLSLTLQRSTLSITCSPLWLRRSKRSLSPTYWITTLPANTDSLSCSCL